MMTWLAGLVAGFAFDVKIDRSWAVGRLLFHHLNRDSILGPNVNLTHVLHLIVG